MVFSFLGQFPFEKKGKGLCTTMDKTFGQIRSFIASIEDEQQIFAHKMNKYTKIYVLIIIKT